MRRGYNVYKGNPFPEKGSDPGFVNSFIFDYDYTKGSLASEGCILVPEGVRLVTNVACGQAVEGQEADTLSEYQHSFSNVVKVDVGFPIGSFTASTDYSDFRESTVSRHEQKTSYYMECQQYQAWLVDSGLPAFSGEFEAAMQTLGAQPTQDAFFQLFDDFGTHFVSAVDLGARYGEVDYLSEEGVEELKKHGLTVEAGAELNGKYDFKIDTTTEDATVSNDIFQKQTTSSWKIQYGAEPPYDGGDKDWNEQWVKASAESPAAMRYDLNSLCNVFGDSESQKACLAAEGNYCKARLDAWRHGGFPHARCDDEADTTTTTPSAACTGCPSEGCCSGGCAGIPGTTERRNEVGFYGTNGLPYDTKPTFYVSKCSVTEGQPWGQPVSDEHGANGAIWWTSRSLIFWAGRKKQEYNAKAFADGLQASNMLGIKRNKVMLPDVLNFAVEGEFAFDLGEGGSHVFQDMRFGQDNNDRWWMGGPTCTNTNGEVLKCTTTEGKAFQFWWKSGWEFQVARA